MKFIKKKKGEFRAKSTKCPRAQKNQCELRDEKKKNILENLMIIYFKKSMELIVLVFTPELVRTKK